MARGSASDAAHLLMHSRKLPPFRASRRIQVALVVKSSVMVESFTEESVALHVTKRLAYRGSPIAERTVQGHCAVSDVARRRRSWIPAPIGDI